MKLLGIRLDTTVVVGAVLAFAACESEKDMTGPRELLSADRGSSPQAGVVHVTGGGTTTFGRDLDGDGDIDGSHFGFGVVISSDGSAQGHFTCLMAGNANFLGLHIMAVQGGVTKGAADGRSFSGTATVKVLNAFGPGIQSMFPDIPFTVVITPGGPGIGTMQLTVFGVFDGVAGDTKPHNGNYDLALETVTSGGITVR
jgi:hypothetical protein